VSLAGRTTAGRPGLTVSKKAPRPQLPV